MMPLLHSSQHSWCVLCVSMSLWVPPVGHGALRAPMLCYDGQTDREVVLVERDAALAQLTARLVCGRGVDVAVSAACWPAMRFMW